MTNDEEAAVTSGLRRSLESRLSSRVRRVPPSPIRRFFDLATTMDDVISLGIGEPDYVTPPPILNAGAKSLREGNTSYTSNAGMLELRAGVARMLTELYDAPAYDAETEVLITVGVSEAMYLAMQALIDEGEEVLVPQPCFVSYTADVILAGGTVVDIPTYAANNFVLTSAQIEAAITPRTKVLLIGYPCNPTGAVMSHEELSEIARVARKHDLIVISDEIYDRLVYDDHKHVMFASLPGMAERTIHLGRHEQGLRNDGLAHRLRRGTGGVARRDASNSPVPDHVGADRRPGGRAACAARPRCRSCGARDGRQLRRTPQVPCRRAERDRPRLL